MYKRGNTITLEGFKILYDNMADSLKMKQLNERNTKLERTYVVSIISIINFITFVLSIKSWLMSVLRYRF